MNTETYFSVKTPLDVDIKTTKAYWEYLITIKHPIMKEKEEIVRTTLQYPDEIRQSKTDKEVFLYYKTIDRLYCVIVKHKDIEGFLITAYPTDRLKEGETVWTK